MNVHIELRTVLARLELISQVPAAELGYSAKSAAHPGGKRPPGGIIHADDRSAEAREYPQKSVEHFKRRIAKAHTTHALEAILEDARKALEAARRQPAPTKRTEPKIGDPGWKRYVAESEESSSVLGARFGKSSRYIREVRSKYREAHAA
jgi:hypothetical protein